MKKLIILISLLSSNILANEEILNFIKKYYLYDKIYLTDGYVNKEDLNSTHLDKIKDLHCSGDFTSLPKDINLLKSLNILDLSNSSLKELRNEVFELSEIYALIISNAKLESISKDIEKLYKLYNLNLSFNSIEELPNEINDLTNLSELHLNNNRLKRLPNIGNLTNLKELYLNNNNLVEVPKGIENICASFNTNLRMPPPNRPCILDISNNRLAYLPKEIANIKGFGCGYVEDSNISLKLLNNFYTKIPNSFKKIKFQTIFPNDYSYSCKANTTQLGYEFFDLDITYDFETNKSISFEPIFGDDLEITNYLWLFGDDTNSTKENPTHTYENYGEYNITLILNHNLSDKKEYITSKTILIYPRVKEFKKSWNLVTTPTTNDISAKLFDEVWSYKDYEWSNKDEFLIPTKGYWVKVQNDFNLSFNGNSYPLFSSNIKPDWNLLGSGEKIVNFDKNLTYYIYKDNSWIENPKEIKVGEGVWVYKGLTPQDRLVKFINSVEDKYVNKKQTDITVDELDGIYYLRLFHIEYLPPEIEYLTNINTISIDYSNIEELPKELFNLPKLTSLQILESTLKKIPKEIANATNLEELSINGSSIEGLPKEIENLTKLKSLGIRTSKTFYTENIFNIKGLKQLSLSANKIDTLNGIGNLKNLISLNITNSKLKELPAEIGELINLEYLTLTSNLLEDLPNEIENLTNLKYLTLTINNFVKFPIEITKLKNLINLNIDRNKLSNIPSEIKNLIKLEYLYVYENKLNYLPSEIGRLYSLYSLALRDNNITKLPDEIGNLSNIKAIGLSNNQIEVLPESIYNLKTLESLYLDGNKLTTLSSKVGNLTNLESLNLSVNSITTLPIEISNLKNLKYLYLIDTPFSDGIVAIPDEIKSMPNLNLEI